MFFAGVTISVDHWMVKKGHHPWILELMHQIGKSYLPDWLLVLLSTPFFNLIRFLSWTSCFFYSRVFVSDENDTKFIIWYLNAWKPLTLIVFDEWTFRNENKWLCFYTNNNMLSWNWSNINKGKIKERYCEIKSSWAQWKIKRKRDNYNEINRRKEIT